MQRSLSSLLAQLASEVQKQTLVPGLQVLARQKSPDVQGSPSSQGTPVGAACGVQMPVAGVHVVTTQALSLEVSQVTTVAGLVSQVWPLGSQ